MTTTARAVLTAFEALPLSEKQALAVEILRRAFESEEPFASADAARAILRCGFNARDRSRMNRLAAKNRQGRLKPEEEEELDGYIRAGQTLGTLQSKARQSLKAIDEPGSSDAWH
jgi:hypothetical protein